MHPHLRSIRWLPAVACILAACNSSPSTATTSTATAPTISTAPVAVSVMKGDSAALTVVAAGSTPLHYQWYRDSVTIAGDTTARHRIPAAAATDSGMYYVTITNSAGSVTSTPVAVVVTPLVSKTAWHQIAGAGLVTGGTYSSTYDDESTVSVDSGGVLTLATPTISKTGNSSDLNVSASLGRNAAVEVSVNSRLYLQAANVTANGIGATGLFATGSGSRIKVDTSSVSVLGAQSSVVGASDGATVDIGGGTLLAASGSGFEVAAVAGAVVRPVSLSLSRGAQLASGTGTLLHVATGASATLTLDGVTVSGRIVADATGAATVVALDATALTSTITGASFTLDASSTWTVAGTSRVAVLSGATIVGTTITNIVGNGFTVTYDATLPANAALGAKTYALRNGGQLTPQ